MLAHTRTAYAGRLNSGSLSRSELTVVFWLACSQDVIATEKVPKGPRSTYKEGEVHYPIYDVVHDYNSLITTRGSLAQRGSFFILLSLR